MQIKSFWKKYYFTIILLTIIIFASVFVILFSNGDLIGVSQNFEAEIPQLSWQLGLILAIVGICAGLLGGWIGTGGCSVMLPVLHFWLGFPAPIAVGTTLFAVIFTAVSGGYGHFKNHNVDKRATLWVGGFGIIGVLLGSWLFTYLSGHSKLLGLIIGLIFLWPAIRMVFEGTKGFKKAKKTTAAKEVEQVIPGKPASLGIFGGLVGTFTGIIGLGGGYALVPGFIYLFKAPVYITMGTSLAVMIPMAVVGGLIKLAGGYVYLAAALILASGTILGAQIGAGTIKKFKPNVLKLIFGLYFLYVAVKFITAYFGLKVW